jgi:hypothetical protein
MTLSIDTIEKNLLKVLNNLQPGETLTLTGTDGAPLALLISLKIEDTEEVSKKWLKEWNKLAKDVTSSWKDEKNSSEVLNEIRR